ncbi:MAG: DNA-binding protein [Candidatus Tectomicrobia bacterium]|uniref:DNA-binding protein n=1 Tax=Tectimicrobiota bacterium TaxID=2528274 RepID=A0A932MQI3_UNCTE|nr:DNA-binding protein [Candidatus Tectomicrobia bacterium]
MMVAKGGRLGEVVVARLVAGEDLLEGMTRICKESGIRNGVILTGFGSVSRAVVSGTATAKFPPDEFYKIDRSEGIEILAISGVVADYHVHAHVALCTPAESFGGHLEAGNIVFSLAEIAFAKIEGMNLKRMRDPVTQQRLLQAVESYEGLPEEDEGGSLHDVAHRMKK